MYNSEDLTLTTALNRVKLISRHTGEERSRDKGVRSTICVDAFFVRSKNIPEVHIGQYVRVADLKKLDPIATRYLYGREYLKIEEIHITKVVLYHFWLDLVELKEHDKAYLKLQLGEEDEENLIEEITNNLSKFNTKYLDTWLDSPLLHEKYKGDLYTSLKLLTKLQ